MKKLFVAAALTATAFATSGCVALLAGAAGAGTVACTEREIDCPVD
ncbi:MULTISPECIES: hypothetical protein [unclassified Sphingosinithalassobacter]|nr:hypothetical protein [Sphingosinithalassobacter sp. CS137]